MTTLTTLTTHAALGWVEALTHGAVRLGRPQSASILFALLFVVGTTARADTVTLVADRDATLIEDAFGGWANGSGPNLFAGRTAQGEGSIRRTLIRFDVAAAVPPGAIVESVTLTLVMNPSNASPATLPLHRVLADWGEGPSSSSGGLGAPAQPGDATWLHTFFDEERWVHPGAQFVARESGAALVEDPGPCTWSSTIHLVADVTLWVQAPERNFGWVLLGDETFPQTVKSFASRENTNEEARPRLTVTYRDAGQP